MLTAYPLVRGQRITFIAPAPYARAFRNPLSRMYIAHDSRAHCLINLDIQLAGLLHRVWQLSISQVRWGSILPCISFDRHDSYYPSQLVVPDGTLLPWYAATNRECEKMFGTWAHGPFAKLLRGTENSLTLTRPARKLYKVRALAST